MRLSGDFYFDEAQLMDIKAVCTYGVTEEDVRVMEKGDAIGAIAELWVMRITVIPFIRHVSCKSFSMDFPVL